MPSGTNIKSVHAILTTILLFPRCVCDEHNGTAQRSAIPRCILMCQTAIVIWACMIVSSCTSAAHACTQQHIMLQSTVQSHASQAHALHELHNISDTFWPWPFAMQDQHKDIVFYPFEFLKFASPRNALCILSPLNCMKGGTAWWHSMHPRDLTQTLL